MRVGLLGELEITGDDGGLVELPGRKPRVLAAILACRANHPVPGEVLADALWGTAPPRQVDANLRVYAHHLRKAFGGARIGRRADGYALRLGPDELDVTRFRALVAEGRAAVAAQRWAHAVERFDAALSLWRGTPLAGLGPVPTLTGEVSGLEELRLLAQEQRIEAELALGRYDRVVAELPALIRRNPLRETFRGQLMRALAGSGRGAEAVQVFEDTRRVLADELGVDPGPRLRELHLSILREEPDPEPQPPVPRQLPVPAAGFVGRGDDLARLDSLLTAADGIMPIAAISGPGGIGKTSLAVHWAHRVRGGFADGQLHVDLRGFDPVGAPADPSEVLHDWLGALGVPADRVPDGLAGRVGLYRTLVADRRLLVVLDNARDTGQVRPLLPGSPHCLVVVTSRDRLVGLVTAEGADPIALDVFSGGEARELLVRRLGPRPVVGHPGATAEIIGRCAGLPLALSIVAARLATNPGLSLPAVAGELSDARRRLDVLAGDDPGTDVRAVLSWSCRILDDDAARLLRLMALFQVGADLPTEAAAALVDLSPAGVRPLLARLVRVHLLTERSPGRYVMHELLRAYAAELAAATDGAADREAARGRLLDHYRHALHAAAVALRHVAADPAGTVDVPEPDAALGWLVTERAALVAAVDLAADGAVPARAWELAGPLGDFLARRGDWHDLRRVQRAALAAAERAAEPAPQAVARRGLARAAMLLGRVDEAEDHLRHALEIYRDLGDRVNEGYCRHNLAIVRHMEGRHRAAVRDARRALRIFRAADHPRGEVIVLNAIGCLLIAAGEPREALRHARDALAMGRRTGHGHREASILDTIAHAHFQLAEYGPALDHYRQGLEQCRAVGDRHLEMVILSQLGDAHTAAGEPGAGRAAWREALDLIGSLDHVPAVAPDGFRKLPDVASLRAKLAAR